MKTNLHTTMRNIGELPVGVPLERPIVPPEKRRRVWVPPTDSSPEKKPSNSILERNAEEASANSILELNAKEAPADSILECNTAPSLAVFMDYDSSAASCPLGVADTAILNATLAPLPYKVVICGGSGTSAPQASASRRRRSRPRRLPRDINVDVVNLLHYGSEPESDESDVEEDTPCFNIPRLYRFLNTDTPEDEEVADIPTPAVPSPEVAAASDEYHFEWKEFPNPPIPPESRRETFSSSHGPTTSIVDPYDIFVAIWDHSFMDYIASETNRYAQQMAIKMTQENTLGPNSRICDWYDTDADELYRYFAILLAMGVLVKTDLVEYWNTTADIFITPAFRTHMFLRRFQLLNRCLHFANSEDMCGRNLSVSEAKLFKIGPVVDHLNDRFTSLYNLGQNISLDESLLMWKGWLSINQLIPNKVAKVGIKSYAVCESQTGYLWRFKLHAHAQAGPQPSAAQSDPMSRATPALVLNLVRGLEHKGHTLWMDNFYNSPALARKLKSLGFDVAGTLRTNRQFVPKEFSSLTKLNMNPGDITGATSGDVDILVWRDHNRVGLISTYHGNAVSGNPPKPILVRDYNVCMGGVDKKDQMLSMYPIERKRTKVWYKKLFRHLLNTSVLNGYLIHKESTVPNITKLSHRQYRVSLIKSLLSKHQQSVPRSLGPSYNSIALGPKPAIFEAKHHYIAEYPLLEIGKKNKSNKTGRARRVCTVCRKRSRYYCAGCNKPSCLLTCFSKMHS